MQHTLRIPFELQHFQKETIFSGLGHIEVLAAAACGFGHDGCSTAKLLLVAS